MMVALVRWSLRARWSAGGLSGMALALAVVVTAGLAGCGEGGVTHDAGDDPGSDAGAQGAGRQFLTVGSAPEGGVFFIVGGAIASVLNEHPGDANWRINAEETGGSQENIRRLQAGEIEFAMSNSSITYFAVRGEGDWPEPQGVRAVATLFPNVAMFVTTTSSGVERIADLRGRRVIVGPPGAGFEAFVGPILQAHGLSLSDLGVMNESQGASIDLLADGAVAAAFLGGGVPTPAIRRASEDLDILLVPFDPQARQRLIQQYPFFHAFEIPAGVYRGQTEPYAGLNVGSAHLITHESVSDELVYQVTRQLMENHGDLHERHRAMRAMTPTSAPTYAGTPFHPGAERYYREQGLWPTDATAPADAPAEEPGEGLNEPEPATGVIGEP